MIALIRSFNINRHICIGHITYLSVLRLIVIFDLQILLNRLVFSLDLLGFGNFLWHNSLIWHLHQIVLSGLWPLSVVKRFNFRRLLNFLWRNHISLWFCFLQLCDGNNLRRLVWFCLELSNVERCLGGSMGWLMRAWFILAPPFLTICSNPTVRVFVRH